MLPAIVPEHLEMVYKLLYAQQGMSQKSYSMKTCIHFSTNTPKVITLQFAFIKLTFMKSQIEHMCETSFLLQWMTSCVRLLVHLAMDGYQQAIQAMQRACFAALSTSFLLLCRILWRSIAQNGLIGQDSPVVIIHGHFEITVLLHIVCYICTLLV